MVFSSMMSFYHTPRYKGVTQKRFSEKNFKKPFLCYSIFFFRLFNILFAENGDAQEQAESDSNKRGNNKAKHLPYSGLDELKEYLRDKSQL